MNTHIKTVVLAIGLTTGIFIGEKYLLSSEVAVTSLFVFIISLAVLFLARRKEKNLSIILFFIFVSFGVVVGILRVQMESPVRIFTCDNKCQFEGMVVSSPVMKDNFQEVVVKVLGGECPDCANILVEAPLYPKFNVGEKLIVEGKVIPPENILPTDVHQKSFDYKNYLLNQNIGSVVSYPKVTSEGMGEISLETKLILTKDKMVTRLNNFVSSPASSLGSGMLFGSASFSKELNDIFRVAGISHIVVLSGFNIAILISFVLAILFFLPLFVRISISVLFVLIFILAVGAEASVVRATIMAFISLLALITGREYVAKQALIISFILIILYDPNALIFSASFHLSFLATAGIIYLSTIIEVEKVLEKKETTSEFKKILAPTISAIIATEGYLLYTFGFLSLYSLITNILIVPFVPIAMLLSFLVVLFSYFSSFLAGVFGVIDSFILNVMIGVARFVYNLPFSRIEISFSLTAMIVYYILVISIFYFYKNREKFFVKEIKDGVIDDEVYSF